VRQPVVNVETAGYISLALLAAGLRFYQLGTSPLAAREASEAMAAWRLLHPGTGAASSVAPGSPLLFAGLLTTFALTGGGDAAARLLPALAGTALVLTPRLFRPWLGRGGALMAAAVLALSPSMIYVSRIVAPDTLALLCGVALMAALMAYLRSGVIRWLYAAAIALGLGLISGPLIYSILALSLLGALALWRQASHEVRASAQAAYVAARNQPGLPARLGVTLAVTIVLGSTVLMAFPAGLGTAGDLLAAWLSGFSLSGPHPWSHPLQLLALYEPAVLLLGIGGLIWQRQKTNDEGRSEAVFRLSSFVILAALILALLRQGGALTEVLLVIYPLALLAGPPLADAVSNLGSLRRLQTSATAAWLAGGLVVMLAFAALNLVSYADLLPSDPATARNHLLVAGLTPIVGLMLVVLLVSWERGLWRAALLVLAGVLLLYSWNAGWGLAQLRPDDPRELWVMQPTSKQVRLLVHTLENASLQRTGMIHSLPVTVQTTGDDVLAWYLRDFDKVTFLDKLGAQVTTPAVVALDITPAPALGAGYRGEAFTLRTRRPAEGFGPADQVKWLVYRGGPDPQPDERVVLWLQAVAGGQQDTAP